MMKTELIKEAKISTNAMEKLCLALDCKMDDILDIVAEKNDFFEH